MILPIFISSTISLLAALTVAQGEVGDCGLQCIADVSGTSCSQAQWTCLCLDQGYLHRLSDCTRSNCNHQDYESTISAVAEICAVFNDTLTVTPYNTATTGTEDPLLSTVAIPSATLPSVSVSDSVTDTSPATSAASTAATSIASTTESSNPTTAAPTSTPASTTTNIARRHDTRAAVYQGVVVALLGLAIYL